MKDSEINQNAKKYTAILCIISQGCSGVVSLGAGYATARCAFPEPACTRKTKNTSRVRTLVPSVELRCSETYIPAPALACSMRGHIDGACFFLFQVALIRNHAHSFEDEQVLS